MGYHYNVAGYVDQITDSTSGGATLSYDGLGNLTSVSSAAGRQINLDYDGSHRRATSGNRRRVCTSGTR